MGKKKRNDFVSEKIVYHYEVNPKMAQDFKRCTEDSKMEVNGFNMLFNKIVHYGNSPCYFLEKNNLGKITNYQSDGIQCSNSDVSFRGNCNIKLPIFKKDLD